MTDDKPHGAYVDRVREDTLRYAQELLVENERLRALGGSLEAERRRLESALAAVEKELSLKRRETGQLQEQLAAIESDNRRFSERFVEIERRNNDLASLYVASYRLHGTLERGEVLTAILEIITNLVGSEEIGVFELSPDGSSLALAASFGIDPAAFASIPASAGRIGLCARTGEGWLAAGNGAGGRLPREAELNACIPLKLEGTVRGVIAVFRLLQQKPSLEALDSEIFDLLANQAAMALYCTELHARLASEVEA